MKLTSQQRAYLRSEAQSLDPVVYVGKEGLTDGVIKALDDALTAHELVKVRFQNAKAEIKEISRALEKSTASTLVATTGFTTVFFRQDSENKERIDHI